MIASQGARYVDCELFLADRDQARFSVAGRTYSGRPTLGVELERRLLEADLDPALYGTELFQALFPKGDDLLAGYRESLTLARHESKRLRLRLHIAATAPVGLHDLHWEMLYDSGQKIALGRSQETAFSRYLGLSFEPGKAVAGRPRLLVVLSCPRDLADYGLPDVDRETMWRTLEQALSPLAEFVTWELLEGPATVENIRDRLVAGEFHALHLAAHGLLPQEEQMARLVLETEDGRASFVGEELFSEVFAGQHDLRLVTLIACHGGAPAGRDPFSGLGPALVRRGVPAVVAMRRQVSLEGAVRFTEHFYRNLARSARVDAAANEARLQLYLGESDSAEWSTPTLFMRLADGRLWQLPDAGAELAGSEIEDQGNEARPAKAVVKTLLLSDLVARARLAEELGDERMAEILSRHDRLARDLLREHQGAEADRADGFLMLFERPFHAVGWALEFHRSIADLSQELGIELAVRVGIHLGEVVLIETPPDDVARGARPLEVEGLARPIVASLTSLAGGGQTLLSAAAFDLARRSTVGAGTAGGTLRWVAHGEYLLEGLATPIAVCEVGVEGAIPLAAPFDNDNVRRAAGDRTILGWRPGIGLEVPQRPNWVLEKKLSEGGFGEVWLAGHEKIRRLRVFKFCFEAERLKALQREITLFRLLKEELGDRDDIARILDWNFEQAPYFIESEYAADGNLEEWAEEQGGIANVPMAQRLEIVAQLATALSAAHSVGVLHKDIKPANVLIAVGKEGRLQVRLSDFGIGTVTERERLAAAGITVLGLTAKTEDESSYSGTRLYMAPELLEGKPATLQADIYALGVILYQAVVGDFTKALAPGWRRDIDDELLSEDIALAADGSPERRLGNALRIAERLRSLGSRQQERETERLVQKTLARSRKRRKLVAAVIAVLVLFVGGVAIHSLRIATAREKARKDAEVVLQFMVDLFEISDPAVARGEKVTARELLERGAEKIRGELKTQPLVQARLMDTIGTVYRQLGLYASAEPLVVEALRIREKHLAHDHVDVAGSLSSVATVYRKQGRNEEAEPLFQRSLVVLEETLGPNHPDLALGLNSLGILYWREGRYENAESYFLRSLKITETAKGADDSEVAAPLNNLALLYSDQGRYVDAEPVYRRALTILEEARGKDDPEVARTVENLGVAYLGLGRFEDAERLCRRALAIREKVLDPGHPDLAISHNNIAEIYKAQSRYREAGERYELAADIWTKAYGPEHRAVGVALNNQADVYRAQTLYGEAEPLYWRALEIFEKVLEPGHIFIAAPLHGLATIYREQQQQSSDAERMYRRALAIREQKLVPGNSALEETLLGLEALLRSSNRQAEAKALGSRISSSSPPEQE